MYKLHKIIIVAVFYFFYCANLIAQRDSMLIDYKSFVEYVLNNHPIAQQAALKNQMASAEMLDARGLFDPTIKSSFDHKSFDGKQYFRIFESELKVPTWYGVDIVGRYDHTSGVFLNPERTTDDFGLWTLGAEANLLQGLLIDDRRAARQQAEVFGEITEQQRLQLLNDLVLDASNVYTSWKLRHDIRKVLTENVEIAGKYYQSIYQSYTFGEKPAIDTLEAYLLFEDRKNDLVANDILLLKAQQYLQAFMWTDNDSKELLTYFPRDTTFIDDFSIDSDARQLAVNHPEILEKQLKVNYLEIERKLKRDKLKPKLKLKYQPLLATSDNSILPTYSVNNFKWGFQYSMPLFFRSERAAIQKTELKIQDLSFDVDNKLYSLEQKIATSVQMQLQLNEQINVQNNIVQGYQSLLDAEFIKLEYGESSVFLLNKRQEYYMYGKIKLAELQAKLQYEQLQYLYLTSQLNQVLGY